MTEQFAYCPDDIEVPYDQEKAWEAEQEWRSKMQESKEYQEAVKLITKRLTSALQEAEMRQGCTNHSYYANILAHELLQQTYPCETCKGSRESIIFPTDNTAILELCPDCKGTGQSNVKVLAVRAKDQTITETLRTELDAYTERLLAHPMNMPQHMEIAIASIVGALKSFVKVVEE